MASVTLISIQTQGTVEAVLQFSGAFRDQVRFLFHDFRKSVVKAPDRSGMEVWEKRLTVLTKNLGYAGCGYGFRIDSEYHKIMCFGVGDPLFPVHHDPAIVGSPFGV